MTIMIKVLDVDEIRTRKQKEQLIHLYCIKKTSISKIADLFEETSEWVEERLEQFGIPLRKKSFEPRRGNGRNETYGYVRIKVDGRWTLEHRHVWEQANGKLPKGWIIHHINGRKDDNRLVNLLGMPRGEHSPQATGLILARMSRIVELESEVEQLKDLVRAYEEVIASYS